MSSKVDKKRVALFCIALIFGGVVAWKAQPLVATNSDAVSIIVTTFSILAGFLVTIMTVIASPSSFSGRSWRYFSGRRDVVEVKLGRQKYLFIAYLLTLALIFTASLVPDSYSVVAEWIQRVYLFLGTMAFIMSLLLPSTLMKIQLEHHDDLIAHHRKQAGISGD